MRKAGKEGRREEQGIGEEGVGRDGREGGREGGRVRGRGRGGRRLVYNVSGYVCTGNNLSFTNVALFTL